MKKQLNLLTTLLYLLPMIGTAQIGKYVTIYPNSGPATNTIENGNETEFEIKGELPQFPLENNNFTQELNYDFPMEEIPTKSGIAVTVNRNFGANNMANSTPMDNTIAISNGGFIVSADNRQVDYYNENGDTIKQFNNIYEDFYSLASFGIYRVFDPKVIYDRYNDRFILAAMDYSRSNLSCIYLSFSTSNTPLDSASWNHYRLSIDSTHQDSTKTLWYDYINIAVNKDEVFITSNVFDNNTFEGNALWQINKQEGYDSLPLVTRTFSNITNANNKVAFNLVPLSESLQSDSYNNGCYLVNTNSSYHDSIYWYKLEGNLTNSAPTIAKDKLKTTYYSAPIYSSQPGGNAGDRIRNGDCRIRSGYYQNGKIHCVYVRDNLDWGEIVYSRINTATNTEEINTWGIANKNYLYPSIASLSEDTITEDAMICFNRVGPNEYPQVCVVNYKNGWSPSTKVIKEGEGILDLLDYDSTSSSYERLGDYTGIQRRYNQKACWLVGSYAFGDTTNLDLSHTNGLNAWIAEVGEEDVSINEFKHNLLNTYPNPVKRYSEFSFNYEIEKIKEISITDLVGRNIPFERSKNTIKLNTSATGILLITIKTTNNELYTAKILVI